MPFGVNGTSSQGITDVISFQELKLQMIFCKKDGLKNTRRRLSNFSETFKNPLQAVLTKSGNIWWYGGQYFLLSQMNN